MSDFLKDGNLARLWSTQAQTLSPWVEKLVFASCLASASLLIVTWPEDSDLPSPCLPSSVKEKCETETRTCPALLASALLWWGKSCLRRGTTYESSVPVLYRKRRPSKKEQRGKVSNLQRAALCCCCSSLSQSGSLGCGWDFRKHPQPWRSLGTTV